RERGDAAHLATQLVDGLTKRGLKPFVDHHPKTGIVPGEDWLQSLRRDLRRAQAVLILVSEPWRLSQWCQAEYRTAKLLNKSIIPVVIGRSGNEDIEPSIQRITLDDDARDIKAEDLDAIARALPSRTLANSIVVTVLASSIAIAAMGVYTT